MSLLLHVFLVHTTTLPSILCAKKLDFQIQLSECDTTVYPNRCLYALSSLPSKLFLLGIVQSCRCSLKGCVCMLTLALSPALGYCILLLVCSQPGAGLHKEEVPEHHCCPVKSQSNPVACLVPEPFFFSSCLFLEDIFWDQLNGSTARNFSPFSLFLFTSIPKKKTWRSTSTA